jgi:RNA polymerase sigma-70 factor (ECF subfamily)
MAADDAGLGDRLRAGDAAAFEYLVRSQTGRLLAVARRITRNEADAEDAVQEAFLSAYKGLAAFDGRSAVSTWLHRIVVNAALQRLRKARSRRETPIEGLLPTFRDGLHAEHPRAWAGAAGDGVTDGVGVSIEEREAVWRAVEQLPDDFRTVLVLRDVEGLESKAVAEALGISDASVRQRLHRGRQALMKLLEPLAGGAAKENVR